MPTLRMTDALVRQAPCLLDKDGKPTRTDYFDAHPRDRQRGLVLRVSPVKDENGMWQFTRTWSVLCRVAGSPTLRRFTLGDYPSYGLGEARDEAAEIIKKAKRGIDHQKEREKARIEAEIAGRDTIEALVEDFLDDMEKRPKKRGGGKRSTRYVEETNRNFSNHVLPRWASRNVREIRRRDVIELLGSVANDSGPIARNRVLSGLGAFFNWAVIDREILDANPAVRMEKEAEIPRDRMLTNDEIRDLWRVLLDRGYPFGGFYRMALLTGQRRDEIAGMRWGELNEKDATWTIPGTRTKGKRKQIVPLSAGAMEVLAQARKQIADIARITGRKEPVEFVFTTSLDAPISGFSRAKRNLDHALECARRRARDLPEKDDELRKALKLGSDKDLPRYFESWHNHDLRRTLSDNLEKHLKIPEWVIAKILNHTERGVTRRHYLPGDPLPEMRKALDAWNERLSGIINSASPAPVSVPADNVVPIDGGRRPRRTRKIHVAAGQ